MAVQLQFTVVSAKIYGGARKLVFMNASKNGAFYESEAHDEAIRYIADKNDLFVSLLFMSTRDAGACIKEINSDIEYFKLECTVINVGMKFVNFPADRLLSMVSITDYVININSPFFDMKESDANRSVRSRSSSKSETAKKRDNFACKACGILFNDKADKSQLEAAHILDVEEMNLASNSGFGGLDALLVSCDLFDANQSCNLISLCHQCHHDYFDKHKICINYDENGSRYFWVVKDDVLEDNLPSNQGKYKDLVDKEIHFKEVIPPKLIAHRMEQFRRSKNGKKRKATCDAVRQLFVYL